MHSEDSPIDRTADLVARVRALREQAEKQMNQFTVAGDYDVRRVTGQKPKVEDTESAPAATGAKKKRAKPAADQAVLDFAPAPSEQDADGGDR